MMSLVTHNWTRLSRISGRSRASSSVPCIEVLRTIFYVPRFHRFCATEASKNRISVEAIMKAVSYKGTHKVAVSDHPKPKLNSPTDAILKVTTSGICGSDLHMYDGRTELKEGTVVGHEIMGIIEQVGEAVRSIKKGDRVVLPFNIACGFCFNCHRGYTNACLTMNPESASAAYGYAGMGPYQGGQAEYVLVPYADFNCLKLPGTPGDEWEDDFLLLADVFPTGYHASELAGVSPGKTVAVFGAGRVGLLVAD